MLKKDFYASKDTNYFTWERKDVLKLLPSGANRILDIGCGAGTLLAAAKASGKASEVVGIDIVDPMPSHDGLDRYVQCDIDELADLGFREYFDVIICADVLEHLINPWGTLTSVSQMLKHGGLLIASIPNVRHYSVFSTVFLKGEFRYRNEGLLDRGHLRFFCRKDMVRMVEDAGLVIEQIDRNIHWTKKILNIICLGMIEEFLVKQYLLRARRP